MPNLPSGTVTFLFTDIENSTPLWEQFPDAMKSALAKHDSILKEAVESNNGLIIKTTGDGIHAVFTTAMDAIKASLHAQREFQTSEVFAKHPRNEEQGAKTSGVSLRIRMGLHTGEAELRDGDYFGGALNRTARIMSIGHGEQILISETTFHIVQEHLPPNTSILDLGQHKLKGLRDPEKIYQISTPDLQQEFPPLKSQTYTTNNLPTQLTSFIGRERELSAIKEKLQAAHLLTLIGPGGTGKTRLSLQLGGEMLPAFRDGVWLVELAPLADQALIVQTIASVLGLRESPGRPLIDLVVDYLRAKRLLLILDNCEHLIEACARVADQLLLACPQLKIIASSREALGISGETVYRVPSLYLPDHTRVTREALSECESIQLFVERAVAANSKFSLTDGNAFFVAQICRRLDGIPLALELAAARVRVLSAEQIAGRLDDRFRLLTGGSRTALPRQQTLQSLIDWSYDLLTEPERAVFRRLAVFVGGWTLEAAEAICAGQGIESSEVLDLLTQLVDKSLVQADERRGMVRYHHLETIRQYARQKLLESQESPRVRERHLEYLIQLSSWAEKNWFGPQLPEVERSLRDEQDNFRAALAWALENQPDKVLQLISWVVFIGLWLYQGFISEAREWSQAAVTRIESLPPVRGEDAHMRTRLLARGWDFMAGAAMNQGEHQASRAAAEKSVTLARAANDKRMLAQGLASLGIGALYSGDPEFAWACAQESYSICQQMGYKRELMWTLNTMIHIQDVKGNKTQARKYRDEMRTLGIEVGLPSDPANVERELSEQAFERGDKVEALKRADVAFSLFEEKQDKYDLTFFTSQIAHQLRQLGDYAEALSHYRKAILLWQDFGHRAAVAHQLECFAFIAAAQNQLRRAVELLGAAEALREVSNSVRTPVEQKEFEDARANLNAEMKEEEFSKVWNKGRSMAMEQAIDYALEVADE